MEERLQRLNIHAVLIKFSCTKCHDHAHPSSTRARDRPRDMVGLPIYASKEANNN